MAQGAGLYRSVLYIPGSKERALDKARSLGCDAIIFDLEDAVAPDEKVTARDILARELKAGGYGPRKRLVRINGLETPWGKDDARAAAAMPVDGVLLPKVETIAQIDAVCALAPDIPIWCMIETPRGVLNALAIADCPAVAGFVLGTNDLAKDLGCAAGANRSELMTALQTTLLSARAAGIICVDGVYNAFKDENGLKVECEQGRALGMDGKTLIHPAQIEIANRVFAPDAAEVDLARRQIAAFEDAQARGEGVAVVDGKIVENLHIVTARALIDRAHAISERETT